MRCSCHLFSPLTENRRQKLGLSTEEPIERLWLRLERLMLKSDPLHLSSFLLHFSSLLLRSQADYTIFFRLLASVVTKQMTSRDLLKSALYGEVCQKPLLKQTSPLSQTFTLQAEWDEWFTDYLTLISDPQEAFSLMNSVNPKYVLRLVSLSHTLSLFIGIGWLQWPTRGASSCLCLT
jgi:uncharacterized protein YdiU (UPF0061 family)